MADTLGDVLPGGALDRLASIRSLLDLIDLAGVQPELITGPQAQRRYRATFDPGDVQNLTLDPATMRVGVRRTNGAGSQIDSTDAPDSWLSFPNPRVTYDLSIDTDATHANATGPFDLLLTLPGAMLTLPWLRGAKLDTQGMLIEDLDHPIVRFHLPRLGIRVRRTSTSGDPTIKLESAVAGPNPVVPATPDTYEFCRMEPNHALVGPGTAIGFTFRTAVLDLSESTNPPGQAKSLPLDWQGLWLPEARIYIAPNGLEDLAVSAGVQDLWIGIGRHSGVTGLFGLDVVNRGEAPAIRARFHDSAGRWIGTEGSSPNLTATLPETTTIIVDASKGIAPFTTTITVDGVATLGTRATVTTPAAGSITITVTVVDGGSRTSTVTITASRKATPALPVPGEGQSAVELSATSGANSVVRVGENETSIVVGLAEADGAVVWAWTGGGTATGATASIPVAAGATVTVTATRTVTNGTSRTFTGYFFFNHPSVADDGPEGGMHFRYSEDPDYTHSTRAVSATDNSWTPGGSALGKSPDWSNIVTLAAGTHVDITGFASFDGSTSADAVARNVALSRRRALALRHLLLKANPRLDIPAVVTADGHSTSEANQSAGRPPFWRAVATFTQPANLVETTTATLHRPPAARPPAPVTNPDPEPSPPEFPDWFRRVGLRLQLDRGEIVLAEINGEIDIRTAAERAIASNDPQAELPPAPNAHDGISQFVVRLDLDKTSGDWKVTAAFRAVDGDTDGLWKIVRPTSLGGRRGVNTLGALAALGPVLAAVAPDSSTAGDYVPLAVTGGAATALAVADVIKTKHVILHGGEAVVAHNDTGTDVTLLLDLETAIGFDAGVVEVSLDKPIVTRYKAIGLRLGDRTSGRFQMRPVFDANRGYTIDIPNGAVVAKGPLGDILKIFGAKVSKDNPTYLSVDVGVGADLGIVHIDRATVRLRLDQPPFELPTLTALGATIEVPGAFTGSGYVQVTDNGLTGSFDVSIAPPIGIRASAGLKIERKDDVLGVFVSVELELPAPIPLGSSGLGIYGFAAGIGINMGRRNPTPALTWLENQPGNDALHPIGWAAQPGAWAFAAGATLGTVDGGFILKMKGLVVLELPGPRVLIVMRARILQPPIDDSYPLLAAIDLSPDSLTIGLLANYDFAGLVKIRVPVQAFFNFGDVEDWSFDLGRFDDPVTVSVLEFFQGTGYLMIHGKGISPAPPAFPNIQPTGIALAIGFHVQFVWGNTDIGLYLKVAGGFDALVSIDPLFVGGKISIAGELRLFIVSIGASASLDAATDGTDYWVHGQVCGKVSFFFFSVKGCVDFTINSKLTPSPIPPALIDGVSLVSRSPALVRGSGSDGPIDGVLASAQQVGTADPVPDPVPLDAIPVVEFAVTPQVKPGLTVLGRTEAEMGSPGTPANPWVRRGAYWWRYEVQSVTLNPVPTGGPTPAVWWKYRQVIDPLEGARLALLSWIPASAPKAVPYGEKLETWVHDQWGSTCRPPAEPVPFLFTFDDQAVGESERGWTLHGIRWPDTPGTYRSSIDDPIVVVSEPWRCGDDMADLRRGIDAADVVGGSVVCPTKGEPPSSNDLAAGSIGLVGTSAYRSAVAFEAATAMLASGRSAREVASAFTGEPRFSRVKRPECRARVLRSPDDDSTEPAPLGDDADTTAVKEAWGRLEFQPPELLDAVAVQCGSMEAIRMLVAVSEIAFNRGVRLRCVAADGSVLSDDALVDVATLGWGGVPSTWWEASGPWRNVVERTARLLARLADDMSLIPAIIELRPPEDAVMIVIGLDATAAEHQEAAPFLLAAVEALLTVEMDRYGYDSHSQHQQQTVLSNALANDPDNTALFDPGAAYTLAVTWKAFYEEGETKPVGAFGGTDVGSTTQQFAFAAQTSAQAPVRLHPWVLDTAPGDAESSAFCDDPVRVTFATQHVADLFDAWGYRLNAVLHGSSGRHPNVGAPPTTGAAPSKHLLQPVVPLVSGLRVESPWEEAVRREVRDLPCVDPGSRNSHVAVELPYPLDPDTNYVLDIVRTPKAGGADVLVYRSEFTTSRFRTLDAFAGTVATTLPQHRSIPTPGPLTVLPERPSGPDLDAAFMAAGLDVLDVPRHPSYSVLWSTAVPPQPVAVVIDANEPLWRSRLAPMRLPDGSNPNDPKAAAWQLAPFEWLKVRTSGTADVGRVVRGPGNQRAVIVLQPNQRGRQLVVDLVRPADPVSATGADSAELLSITVARAPWEEL